jgi:hypothetical protein
MMTATKWTPDIEEETSKELSMHLLPLSIVGVLAPNSFDGIDVLDVCLNARVIDVEETLKLLD